MRSISVISKSKVGSLPIPKKKKFFIRNELNIIKRFTFLLLTEALFGINRLFLLQYNKYITKSTEIYSLVLLCVLFVYNFQNLSGDITSKISMVTYIIEYTLFILITLTSRKNLLRTFFKNLNIFDEILNIQNNLAISSVRRVVTWTFISVLCNSFEVFLLTIIYNPPSLFVVFSIFVMTTTHDMEQVFFLTYLHDIYMRILIVKAHVAKLYDEIKPEKFSKVEKLSENMELEVSTLHRAYELLHECSGQINSAMNIPVCEKFISEQIFKLERFSKHLIYFRFCWCL